MNSITIVFLCLVLCVVHQHTDALSCYVCLSGTDGCGPSFRSTGSGIVTQAATGATQCTKTVYASNTNNVARGYVTGGTCTEGSSTTNGVTSSLYCCTTDLCNQALMEKASFFFAMLSAMLGLLLVN